MWPVDNYYLRPLNKGVCSLTILRSQQCIRIFSLWYYRVGTLINVGMLETTHEQVLESLFSGSLSHHLKEMPLLMKINVSFACDTKTCKIITILFFMHGLGTKAIQISKYWWWISTIMNYFRIIGYYILRGPIVTK